MLDLLPSPHSALPRFLSAVTLVIGSDTTVDGAIAFDGDIELQGRVCGELRCRSLTVAESASVEGVIVADHVKVAGMVSGSIYANALVLAATCAVDGLIVHHALSLEPGSYFEGKSRRFPNPLQLATVKSGQ